jgi:hypothetical protein
VFVIRAALFVGLLVAMLPPVHASLMDELSSADQARVLAGQQVMVTEPIDGYPWPRAKVYQLVKATPRQVMAVFFDYNSARSYVPNCTKSRIAKEIDPRTFEVDYVVDIPIFPDEAYTVRNELCAGAGGALSVKWNVLHATSILESRGSLRVEPEREDAILCYTNLVKPSSRAAVLLKGVALGQMKDTVNALVGQVAERRRDPQALAPEMARLEEALGTELQLTEAKSATVGK